MIGLITFEACAGIYRPSIALLRSAYIPNEGMYKIIYYYLEISHLVRATIMSYMRVPQLIIMLIILLSVSSQHKTSKH